MVFICSPGPTVVGLLSRSLRTVPEVQGLSPGGDIGHHELIRKGEEKGRAEIRKDAEGDVGLDSDAPTWSAVGVHPRGRPRQGAESEGGVRSYMTCVEMIIRLLKVRLGRIIGLLEDGIRDYVSYVIIRLFKVGMVQEESPAERAGLRTRDFLWKVCDTS